MTDSSCWIDLQDDEELVNRVHTSCQICGESACVDIGNRYLWISDLREWAAQKELPIEYPSLGLIAVRITVNKSQLLGFLEDMLGPAGIKPELRRIDTIRALIREYGKENCRFRIFADEY
ncbi:MAG: hypothetical protein EBU46_11145 [Nitrosomonadaceae bacterium]|nr:hypothetical protein [Nitrosomonadaceae bacterium]